jgi:hypothetical protein
MRLWPWQSPTKEIKKRLEEVEKDDFASITISSEDFFESLRNRPKPKFYVRWYYRASSYLYDLSWTVYRWFKPCNKSIRDSIPRQWIDLCDLIRIVNFKIVVSFYEEEYKDAYVEFDREFVVWLEYAYFYIKKERQTFLDAIDIIHEKNYDLPYKDRSYKDILEMEDKITSLDDNVLNGVIKYRAHFWT